MVIYIYGVNIRLNQIVKKYLLKSKCFFFYPKEVNMKYKITLTESNKGFVTVEALNREHAVDKAMEAYHNGNIDWEYALPTISKVELSREVIR